MTITEHLAGWLSSGEGVLGQIILRQKSHHGWELRHEEDRDRPADELEAFRNPEDARELARFSDSGEYRYLKGGRDLRHGWRLELADLEAVRTAIDAFYPAILGMLAAGDRLRIVPLRETLERQTGMYRFARTISDEGVEKIMDERCRRLCLREVLWPIGEEGEARERPKPEGGRLPLVCSEACNFLVADARKVAKAEFEAKQAAE